MLQIVGMIMVEIVARWEHDNGTVVECSNDGCDFLVTVVTDRGGCVSVHKTKEEAENRYKRELMAWIPGYMEARDEDESEG